MTASHTVGANFAETKTTPEFGLGDRAQGADGTEWIYVQANGAITQYDTVGVDEDFQAAAATATIAGDAWLPGWAQVAFADNAYGWVAVRGSNIYARAINVAADAPVTIGGSGVSAGVLSVSGGTSAVALVGVVCVTSAGSTASHNVEIIATNPYFDV